MFIPLIGHYFNIYIKHGDDCNLAHTKLNIDISRILSGVPARRFTLKYLTPMPQNNQDLDKGRLQRFLTCLNLKNPQRLQNLHVCFRQNQYLDSLGQTCTIDSANAGQSRTPDKNHFYVF